MKQFYSDESWHAVRFGEKARHSFCGRVMPANPMVIEVPDPPTCTSCYNVYRSYAAATVVNPLTNMNLTPEQIVERIEGLTDAQRAVVLANLQKYDEHGALKVVEFTTANARKANEDALAKLLETTSSKTVAVSPRVWWSLDAGQINNLQRIARHRNITIQTSNI